MKYEIKDGTITINGTIPSGIANDVVRALFCHSDFIKDITWEEIKRFNAGTRVRFLRNKYWGCLPIPPKTIADILLHQCSSVVGELLRFSAGYVATEQSKNAIMDAMKILDTNDILKLWNRSRSYSAWTRFFLAKIIPTDLIPILMTDKTLYKDILEIFEKRLKGESTND